MEVAQKHISDISHVTPLSKNCSVQLPLLSLACQPSVIHSFVITSLSTLRHTFLCTHKVRDEKLFHPCNVHSYVYVPPLKFMETFHKEFCKRVEILDHQTEFAGLFLFTSCIIYLSQFSPMSWVSLS
jgi:hypothetical protein